MEKRVKAFRKTLSKKGFVEERGFRELIPPFKEEVERRGWEMLCKYLEPGIRALVKELYANLGDKRNLTYYIRGRWVPFEERAISQLFGLREGGDCTKFERLQKNPNFKEIAKELTGGKGEWQRTRTISNAFINRGDLIEVRKVWLYFVNSVLSMSQL